MRRSINLLICAIFIVGLFLGPSAHQVGAAQDEVIKLKFGHNVPPASVRYGAYEEWIKEVEKRTKGRVKITMYGGGSLVKTRDILQGLSTGITDFGAFQPSMDASAYPLNLVMDLPFMGFPSLEVATRIWMEIIDRFPEVRAEFRDVKLLWVNAAYPHTINTSKKEIRNPNDLKGVKIGAFGMTVKIAEILGATPISVHPPELYMGLEKGVFHGIIIPYGPMRSLKLIKLLPYHNTTVINNMGAHFMMSLRTWKSLPPDIQKIFIEISPWARSNEAKVLAEDEEKSIKIAKDLGHTFIKNTPEEMVEWKNLVKPVHEKWIADNEAKGLPARTVYDEVQKLIKKHSR